MTPTCYSSPPCLSKNAKVCYASPLRVFISQDKSMEEQTYDAIVIGAGLGGLLSAAQLLQRNKRVVVLDLLPHSRLPFTPKTFQELHVTPPPFPLSPSP